MSCRTKLALNDMGTNAATYRWMILLLTCCFFLESMAQFDIPEKPQLTKQTAVYDYVNLLSQGQDEALSNKLIRYADSTSTQIVVIIIATTQGEDISFLGAKWGQSWGIGQSDKDNGVLVLLARDDRQIDINTGYGIETIVTDRMAEQIINRIMIPSFKNGDYYEGLDNGTNALIAALSGEYKEERTFEDGKIPFGLLIFIIIVLVIFLSTRNKNNRKGRKKRGFDLLDMIILSQMGKSRSFGGSSGRSWGSGGFGGGFGGGGFGGGGASGSW